MSWHRHPASLAIGISATFALNPFAANELSGLAEEPTIATEVPILTRFDAAGGYLIWEQNDNLRAAILQDDGGLMSDIDVARGDTPSISMTKKGPALVYLQDGKLRLSELGGLTLQCEEGGFCNVVFEPKSCKEP